MPRKCKRKKKYDGGEDAAEVVGEQIEDAGVEGIVVDAEGGGEEAESAPKLTRAELRRQKLQHAFDNELEEIQGSESPAAAVAVRKKVKQYSLSETLPEGFDPSADPNDTRNKKQKQRDSYKALYNKKPQDKTKKGGTNYWALDHSCHLGDFDY